jgi:branched-chain amino acid transport system ATP-binding protein
MAVEAASVGRSGQGRHFDEVLLEVRGITLRFGGVSALSDVSFDIKKGEIRSIIGPNGAGKSSMLNVINGFYHAQEGTITYKGRTRRQMRPHQAAVDGIGRTFQNIALFRGMTTLDNLMTGRILKMRSSALEQAIYLGRARREELAHRAFVEQIIDFLEIEAIRNTPVGRLPYGMQKRVELGRALEVCRVQTRPWEPQPNCSGCPSWSAPCRGRFFRAWPRQRRGSWFCQPNP